MKQNYPFAIEIFYLYKSFPHKKIYENLSLTIKKGENIVILGESGSGKSVLLNLIIGFEKPDNGKIKIFGQDLVLSSQDKLREIRDNFAIVFQNSAIFDNYTVGENIFTKDTFLTGKYIPICEINNILEKVSLKNILKPKSKATNLSGGQKKRLAIARALATNANLIIYDEPTSGLDYINGERISNLISEINSSDQTITTITITHDFNCAIKAGEKILYLDKNVHNLVQLFPNQDINTLNDNTKIKLIEEKIKNINLITHIENYSKTAQNNQLNKRSSDIYFHLIKFPLLLFKLVLPYRKKDILRRVIDYSFSSLPLIIIFGIIVGMIITLQLYSGTKDFMQYADINIPKTITENMIKIFSSFLTGILLSGKIGNQITTEIGIKNYSEQFKALESMSINTKKLFLSPIYFSLFIVVPLLTIIFSISGIVGAYLVWTGVGESGLNYFITFKDGIILSDVIFLFIKSIIITNLITFISYTIGSYKKNNIEEISNDTTLAFVILSILIIFFELISNYIYEII